MSKKQDDGKIVQLYDLCAAQAALQERVRKRNLGEHHAIPSGELNVPPSGEIVIHQLAGRTPPKRRARGSVEPIDDKLVGAIAAALPPALPPISALGLESALGAMAHATKVAFVSDFRNFATWCTEEGRTPIPADPEDLVRYLLHLENEGKKPATLARNIAMIAVAHKLVGLGQREELPTRHIMVRNAIRANRRRKGTVQRQAAALRYGGALDAPGEDNGFTITAMLNACGDDAQGLRNAAMVSLGYDAGLRVSELTSAAVDDLSQQSDGSGLLFIPRSKTDQEGSGSWAWISADSMRRMNAWLVLSSITDGPMFRRIWIDRRRARAAKPPRAYDSIPGNTLNLADALRGTPAVLAQVTYTFGDAALTRQGVCGIYRRIATAAGDAGLVNLSEKKLAEAIAAISTHSLRVGLTQDLFAAGEDGVSIALTLRWTSASSALRYGRKMAARSNAAARLLGKIRN